jgi:hypothetical protein
MLIGQQQWTTIRLFAISITIDCFKLNSRRLFFLSLITKAKYNTRFNWKAENQYNTPLHLSMKIVLLSFELGLKH